MAEYNLEDYLNPNYNNVSGTVREQVFDGQNRAWDISDTLLEKAEVATQTFKDIAAQFETNPSILNTLVIDDVKINEILTWLESDWSHGLNPANEGQNWDRARERTLATMNNTVRQITRRASAAGWEQPPGALYDNIQQAEQAAAMEISGLARDIAIQQNEYEINATKLLLSSLLGLKTAIADLDKEKIRLHLTNSQTAVGYLMEAQKSMASIIAQMAASTLSTININASTSSSTGAHVGHSENVSYDGGNGSPPIMIVPL